jgi:hypothetical protein
MATAKTSTSKTANTAGVKAGLKGRTGLAAVDLKLNLAEVRKEARKPLFAYVGAGDYAVEQIKRLPEVYSEARANYRSAVTNANTAVTTAVKDYRSAVQTLPATVKELPTSLKSSLTELSGKANEFYGDFVQRGEKLVTSIRRQPATQEAVSEAKTAARQTRTATTHARRSAGAGKAAAKSAAAKTG